MPDINSLIFASCIMFIKRLICKECNCYKTAQNIIQTKNLNYYFQCKSNIKYLKISTEFYNQVMKLWLSIHNDEPTSYEDIANEIIWNNENILVDNKPMHMPSWEQKGIYRLNDIMIGNRLMTREELIEKYTVVCPTLLYNGLVSAIPHKWKNIIKEYNATFPNIRNKDDKLYVILNKEKKTLDKLTHRDVYWSEIHNKSLRPTVFYKWESEFYFAEFDWKVLNIIPYECARETSLQSLQYTITNRFFPCNYQLHLWNIKMSNVCDYCENVDTVDHFFYYCEHVHLFWKYLKNWVHKSFKVVIGFKALDILLGLPNYNRDVYIDILNFVILYGKYYIKICRQNVKNIDLYRFLVMLKERMYVEKYIYHCQNKNDVFDKRWSILLNKLEF